MCRIEIRFLPGHKNIMIIHNMTNSALSTATASEIHSDHSGEVRFVGPVLGYNHVISEDYGKGGFSSLH